MARKVLIEKTCTKTGETFTGTFDELTEFFYRDKSQKDGLSPWCKAAEKAYNKAYTSSLKEAGAPRKRDLEAKGVQVFEEGMISERVPRGKAAKAAAKTTKVTTLKAKAPATRARRSTKK
jgi:hypothetical protein